jgi:hypothetical protein
MTDIMLRGALTALKTKIAAIAQSKSATAEDLALLGTALERIAGKTTAIEIEMLGEEHKAAMTDAANTERDRVLAAVQTASDEADTILTTVQTTVDAKIANAQTATDAIRDDAINQVGTIRVDAIAAMGTERDAMIAQIDAAAADAISAVGGFTAERFFLNQL